MYEFYRQTLIGRSLQDCLEDLLTTEELSFENAQKVLRTFDESIPIVFNRTVTSTLSFKGAVESYNYVDGVWNFIMKDFVFTTNNKLVKSDYVKIVACDGSGTEFTRKKRGKRGRGI